MDNEIWSRFEQRKRDHINLALDQRHQAQGASGLECIRLTHDALPELNFEDINLSTKIIADLSVSVPVFVSSMTLGHDQSASLNRLIVDTCARRGWAVAVGSQRRQLTDPNADKECRLLRSQNPNAILFGNLGLAQIIDADLDSIQRLMDSLQAQGLFIHLNPLQECIQPEGTPNFRGGVAAISRLAKLLDIPVIVKETGCGLSKVTIQKLMETGIHAVDVSGLGGTHWGRIEGSRANSADPRSQIAEDFALWGVPTVESLQTALELQAPFQIWASGGVRSGLDVAKLLALGACYVGIAQPILAAALKGEEALDRCLECIEYGLKTAMFCMGLTTVTDFHKKKELWKWQQV